MDCETTYAITGNPESIAEMKIRLEDMADNFDGEINDIGCDMRGNLLFNVLTENERDENIQALFEEIFGDYGHLYFETLNRKYERFETNDMEGKFFGDRIWCCVKGQEEFFVKDRDFIDRVNREFNTKFRKLSKVYDFMDRRDEDDLEFIEKTYIIE